MQRQVAEYCAELIEEVLKEFDTSSITDDKLHVGKDGPNIGCYLGPVIITTTETTGKTWATFYEHDGDCEIDLSDEKIAKEAIRRSIEDVIEFKQSTSDVKIKMVTTTTGIK